MAGEVKFSNKAVYWHGVGYSDPYTACYELLGMMKETFVAAENDGYTIDFSTLKIAGESTNMGHSTDFTLSIRAVPA